MKRTMNNPLSVLKLNFFKFGSGREFYRGSAGGAIIIDQMKR